MAKGLKVLFKQLRQNHGIRLITTFDDAIVPGSLVETHGWSDVNPLSKLWTDPVITRADLGPVEGPTQVGFVDFSRKHELNMNSALDLIKPKAAAKAGFDRAKEAVATFESPVAYGLDLVTVENAIEKDPEFWNRNLGARLLLKNVRVVLRIYRARLSFFFKGSSGASVDLQATPAGDLAKAGLKGGWTWRNSATLESRKEILVGVELYRYNRRKKRLVAKP